MIVETTVQFRKKLNRQILYIAYDKPKAAQNLKKLIYSKIAKLSFMPYKCRISNFFQDENIRDLIVKGYCIVYRIEKENNKIIVFGFHKWEEDLKE